MGKYDARLWAYDAAGDARWTVRWDNPAAKPAGKWPDFGRGVVATGDGGAVLVGETFAKEEDLERTRALALRFSPSGEVARVWIAPAWPDLQSGLQTGRPARPLPVATSRSLPTHAHESRAT